MTDRPDLSTLPSYKAPKRSLFSARKLALMASVVAGLGAATYGFSPSHNPADLFTTPAHAQVNNEVKKVQQPVGFADIVERVKPSVISVKVNIREKVAKDDSNNNDDSPFQPGSPMERFFRRFGGPDGLPPGLRGGPRGGGVVTGQGSGFFISADGFAVTNNHVVDGADKVEVTTDDGKTYSAKVIGTDPRTDLALIKVEGGSNFQFAKLSETKPRIGDWVLAVGNPFGLGGTVTAGIVSASGRDIGNGPYDDFIQIDAPVNKGNSGGPAFDVSGEVMGVNTAIYSPSGGSVGIAFSIPAQTVKSVVAQLKDKGAVSRGWIGVQIQPVTSDIADSLGMKKAEGALVAEPQANGPAAKAGIESGDVITAVNGEPVKDARELARTIGGLAPGNAVKLNVLHKGQDKTVNLTLGQLPNNLEAKADTDKSDKGNSSRGTDVPKLGLTVAPANSVAGAGKDGVVVTEVDPKSAAAERGFKEGDVILEVAGKSVGTAGEVRDAITAARNDSKNSVLMRVKSGGSSRFVAVPLAKG
ncbi:MULTISPECIES: Do family serine endopeptidase [Bradyrhizobium]|uniref:Probable periplasmic serine endoprotease DegP-like n=1 Tax=Bradyrhizobium brasilense TaxID=1419277 RepID=A0A1R1QDF3_9BRAD|nr:MULTISPECIES: Do family serine endopeptidase [Bradyrhizobium]MCP1908248.1 serine protease Do [Bradyrhizobium elkanii]KRP87040.1 serine peptidase [Bradyrhizobium pachyrhizi]MCA1397983.1 Do family serine endopeptidase [Bradyrhizobium sp. BRP56]MCA6097365.1 Do family serine endopeptidase [Bradyrhizobium australafricanum]MCC8945367.1 Do family serine endopeptidase [Bradyrhizobium brasilense]